MSNAPPHLTRTMTTPAGHVVAIDEGIADLIAALWSREIETAQSCEEFHPAFAWLAFHDAEDALDFLRAIDATEDATDELSQRAVIPEVACPDSTPPSGSEWRWSCLPRPSADMIAVAVEFPRDDLPEIMRRLGA